MRYLLFPSQHQFEPLDFNNLSDLSSFCRDNSIKAFLLNEKSQRAKLFVKALE